MSEKLPLEVTPRGVAAYVWLYKKDDKFAKDPSQAKHKLTLVIDKEEVGDLKARLDNGETEVSAKEWLAHIEKMHADAGGGKKDSPAKDGDKPLGKADAPKEEFKGKWLVQMKTGFPANLVDTKRNDLPEDVKIFSGDVVKAVYRPFVYDGGVSLRLNAVMLVEKRASGGGTEAFGDDEEGFVAEKSGAKEAFGGEAAHDNDGDY